MSDWVKLRFLRWWICVGFEASLPTLLVGNVIGTGDISIVVDGAMFDAAVVKGSM